jgi:hypothetical protein
LKEQVQEQNACLPTQQLTIFNGSKNAVAKKQMLVMLHELG